MSSSYPIPFFGSDSERIRYYMDLDTKTDIFRMSEMVRIRTAVGAEADFLKSDNMCLRVVFYDEKRFINQSHKTQY